MAPAKRVLHWFRRDLRLADNPALAHAAARGDELLAVYIHAPDEEAPWAPGGASRWWLHESLTKLRGELQQQGISLLFFHGSSRVILRDLCGRLHIDAVSWNRRYEPACWLGDEAVSEALRAACIEARPFDDGVLSVPGSLLNRQGLPYRVYTPFMRQLRHRLMGESAADGGPPQVPALQALPVEASEPLGCSLDQLGLLDRTPWHDRLKAHWQTGERAAWQRLQGFLRGPVADYAEQRDRPDRLGTSGLSPHLHFGEISLQRILGNLQPLLDGTGGLLAAESAERFLSQLIWRDFARHLLWHFPHSDRLSLDGRFDALWFEDEATLQRWQRGTTGIDLVDAGMRQLWQTGWMHNRVRMVAGSLLSKNLGIPWQAGARWFWDTLVDADLANNSLGWQWVAGCGADAAPYFRVFNAQLQAKKFDPKGAYRSHWLAGRGAVEPLVDLAESRLQALARYQQMRQG